MFGITFLGLRNKYVIFYSSDLFNRGNMHILMTGGTGFIGRAFVKHAIKEGHTITILSRAKRDSCDSIDFVRNLDEIDSKCQIDVVINLAGAPLGEKRWSESYKIELLESRLGLTERLIKFCKRLSKRPAVILSASAIGYYGSRGDEVMTEVSSAGTSFSSKLCRDWERLWSNRLHPETRLCCLRFGVVFGRSGGALKQLSQSFRFKVGTQIGTGNQWMSWVHLEDAVRAMIFLIQQKHLIGVFNVTSPNPVIVSELNAAIARRLPVYFHLRIPGKLIQVMLGEMATELLLASQRVIPDTLSKAGFKFAYPELDAALKKELVES